MPIVGGLDIHRKQITFDYLDTETGQVQRGQIAPADRVHLRARLARFNGREDVAFAVEGCAGWRYVAEELAAAGIAAHLAEPARSSACSARSCSSSRAPGRSGAASAPGSASRPPARRRRRGAFATALTTTVFNPLTIALWTIRRQRRGQGRNLPQSRTCSSCLAITACCPSLCRPTCSGTVSGRVGRADVLPSTLAGRGCASRKPARRGVMPGRLGACRTRFLPAAGGGACGAGARLPGSRASHG